MITGIAHTALCVTDLDAAVAWYHDVLGFTVLSPPYLMEGDAIERDMGELVPSPVALRAAIVGVGGDCDRVIEIIEYPNIEVAAHDPWSLTRAGFTHVGLVCDDIDVTRRDLESRGAEFLTAGTASIARLRTTWFRDPWHNVFILMERHDNAKPYYAQYGG